MATCAHDKWDTVCVSLAHMISGEAHWLGHELTAKHARLYICISSFFSSMWDSFQVLNSFSIEFKKLVN